MAKRRSRKRGLGSTPTQHRARTQDKIRSGHAGFKEALVAGEAARDGSCAVALDSFGKAQRNFGAFLENAQASQPSAKFRMASPPDVEPQFTKSTLEMLRDAEREIKKHCFKVGR